MQSANQQKLLFCGRVGELGGYTKWNMTWSPRSSLFCWHLGWFESLKWWQGIRVETQWGKCTCEWELRVEFQSLRILQPQGREPLPQPHSQVHSPHWVEILVPCHQFRDSSHPRCQLNRWDPGDQVMFHFVYPPSSQTRSQVNFLSWTPFGDPSAHFFYPVIVHPKAVACPNY